MTTHGAQMDRKWTGSGLEVTGSGPEVDWMCPSVRPYVCPSQTLPLPPLRTLCEGSKSALRFYYINFDVKAIQNTNLNDKCNSVQAILLKLF